MADKHTPGPWRLEQDSLEGWFEIHSAKPDDAFICGRAAWPRRAAESTANARLIAAAPALLEIMQEVVTCYDAFLLRFPDGESEHELATAIDMAKRVLRKARGEQ